MPIKNTIHSIQALRAIAAALVVVLHCFVHLHVRHRIPGIPSLVDAGRAGVDIFFVISGFIMVYISADNFQKEGASKDFFVKRLIRIAPTYWLYTLLMAALLFSFPYLFSDNKEFSLGHLLASLSFIPWNNSVGEPKPVLPVGWTLNFEMYFYLIFAFLLIFSRRYFIPLLTALLLGGIAAGFMLTLDSPVYYVVTSSLLIEFLLGCIIGLIYKRQMTPPPVACAILAISGAGLLIATGIYDASGIARFVKWGIPGALVVAGVIFLERSNKLSVPAFLVKLGNSSYSLYLTHLFTINAAGKVWSMTFGAMYEVFIPVAILAAISVGHAAYLLFERPLTNFLNNAYTRYAGASGDMRKAKSVAT